MEEQKADSKTVLVVEDSSANRQILVNLLTQMGFTVVETTDGNEAMDYLSKNPEAEICTIVTDYMMPNKNGLELITEVRAIEKFVDTPVFFVSAVSEREKIKQLGGLKVHGYLLKPIKAEVLSTKLLELFPGDEKILKFRKKYKIK